MSKESLHQNTSAHKALIAEAEDFLACNHETRAASAIVRDLIDVINAGATFTPTPFLTILHDRIAVALHLAKVDGVTLTGRVATLKGFIAAEEAGIPFDQKLQEQRVLQAFEEGKL